eukprot:scaffold49941_cov18-Tisochrysis_lutea.AAC.1
MAHAWLCTGKRAPLPGLVRVSVVKGNSAVSKGSKSSGSVWLGTHHVLHVMHDVYLVLSLVYLTMLEWKLGPSYLDHRLLLPI